MIDGIISEILRFPPLNGYRIGVKSPLPFLSPTNDTMLVTVLAKVRLSDNFPQSSLILYNLTKRQFVYDTVDYSRQSSGFPVIANSKIYNDVGGGIQCNDLWTGKLLWRRDFGVSFLFSGVEVAEGKVFAGGEDTNFYCLDAETGNTLWTLKGVAGGTRKPFVMNGVVYFANGSLYAVDVNTGQILSKPYSPDGEGFFGRVTGSIRLPKLRTLKIINEIRPERTPNIYRIKSINWSMLEAYHLKKTRCMV
jgi:outer membrane protein assembly factor BamB